MKKLFKNSIFIILVVIWLAMPVMASSITPPDDHGNSFKEATEIDLPIKNLKGEISYPGDKDYFKFTTTMERKISYAFRTQAGEIELYDENLNKISTDDVLQAWHTYYIVIYHEDATEKIQYDLDIYLDDINTPQVDDYGDSFEEATEINIPISVGSGRFKIEGRIDYSGDKDFFRFIPEAEGRLKSVKNTEIGQRQLYDENQNRIPDDEVLKPGHIYYIVLESNFVGKVEYCTIKFKLISAILYGDVNRDQRVNSTDLTLMKRELLGVDISNMMFDYDAADIDGNGKFNSTDYAWLQRYLLDQVDVFPRDINGDGYIND